jgi:hypothetical protein
VVHFFIYEITRLYLEPFRSPLIVFKLPGNFEIDDAFFEIVDLEGQKKKGTMNKKVVEKVKDN